LVSWFYNLQKYGKFLEWRLVAGKNVVIFTKNNHVRPAPLPFFYQAIIGIG
jgi:hypothetical protein